MLTRMVTGTTRRARPFAWPFARPLAWPFASGAAALVLLTVPIAPAQAGGGVSVTTCSGSFRAFGCVERWGRAVDPHIRVVPRDPNEEAAIAERDARWVARCRPVIRQDRYGVPRYYYAAAGCEHGVIGE